MRGGRCRGGAAEPVAVARRAPASPLGRAAVARCSTQGLEGLPIVKPPYGVLSAIDVNKGDLLFQVPHGDTPDVIRNHPLLKGMNIGKTGQGGSVGVLITKTLVIVGDPQFTTREGGVAGAMPARVRQEDRRAGRRGLHARADQRFADDLQVDGRQYIVVAVSGGGYTGEYISFALPPTETRPTTAQQRQ